MAYYIFNVPADQAEQAIRSLRSKVWAVDEHEPYRDALAPGDLALVYLAAPAREFVGRAEVAGSTPAGVALTEFVEWNPAVAMSDVLARIDQSAGARADFETGVVQITSTEYETALSVADR